MLVVCLDQCAISALALEIRRDPAFAALRDFLSGAVHRGEVVCPVAGETLVETCACEQSQRIAISELHMELAAGEWMFKTYRQLLHEETLALARSLPPPPAFFHSRWKAAGDDAVAAKVAADLDATKNFVHERVEQMPLVQLEGPVNAERIREALILELAGHVWRQLERLRRNESPDPKDYLGVELADFLLSERITIAEVEKLMEDVRARRWEQIRVVIYRALLGAQIEMDYRRRGTPRRHRSNDDIDILRLSVGCFAADLVISDGPMAHLARNAKLSEWGACEVFSIKKPRLIVEHVKKLIQEKPNGLGRHRTG